ncbi:hypothetical protein D1871_19170 [Nakamurella silvestris]|nr:hypothetical protein D1871_19170 [Nakamurella silvestris]
MRITCTALMLSACTSTHSDPDPGPLSAGRENTLSFCTELGEPATYRSAVWNYTDGPDLTIDSVDLVDPVGLDLVASVIVPNLTGPNGEQGIIGISPGYPPRGHADMGQDWDARIDAAGATLSAAAEPAVLYVVLQRSGPDPGSAQGTLVRYHDSRTSYQVTVQTSYLVRAEPCGNDSPPGEPADPSV